MTANRTTTSCVKSVHRKGMIDHSILGQIAIYFMLPLSLAIVHAMVGVPVVSGAFSFLFGTAEYVENKSDDCGYRPADLWDIFPDYVLRIPHGGAGSKTQAEEAVSLAEQLPVLCLI